jgi:hypothetical protein
MKERPILFSAPMVCAILEGRKTQTRRICAYQNFRVEDNIKHPQWGPDLRMLMADSKDGTRVIVGNPDDTPEHALSIISCPHGKPGDRLWVRETFGWATGAGKRLVYRADGEEPKQWFYPNETIKGMKWSPSIHMPRWASRLTLEITGVRVERLQEISGYDAHQEGCRGPLGEFVNGKPEFGGGHSVVEDFRELWNSLADKKTNWAANPWVWVIGFKKL